MSGTSRAGVVFGLGAAVASVGAVLLPFGPANYAVALVALATLGWGAGYTAAKVAPADRGNGIGRGAVAGALAGVVVLTVFVFAMALIGAVDPLRLALRAAFEHTPQINEPGLNPVAAANLTGAGAGFFLGLIALVVLSIGGVGGGLTWRGLPSDKNAKAPTYRNRDDVQTQRG